MRRRAFLRGVGSLTGGVAVVGAATARGRARSTDEFCGLEVLSEAESIDAALADPTVDPDLLVPGQGRADAGVYWRDPPWFLERGVERAAAVSSIEGDSIALNTGADRDDWLHVLMHELAHCLGYDHDDAGVAGYGYGGAGDLREGEPLATSTRHVSRAFGGFREFSDWSLGELATVATDYAAGETGIRQMAHAATRYAGDGSTAGCYFADDFGGLGGEVAGPKRGRFYGWPTRPGVAGDSPTTDTLHEGSPDDWDVFTVGGQSNAEGRGTAADTPGVPEGVAFEYRDGGLVALEAPVGDATTGSAWPAFARAYHERTGRGVVLVPLTEGGSVVTAEAGYSDGSDWSERGDLRDDLVGKTARALTYLGGQDAPYTYRGVLWHQGESDAIEINEGALTRSDYRAAMTDLLSAFRARLGRADLPVWLFELGQKRTGQTMGMTAVRDVQNELVDQDRNAYICSDIQTEFAPDQMQDNWHYTQTGYNEMGREGARTLASIL